MPSNIQSIITCKTCYDLNRKARLHVGLTDPMTLRVWCQACDKLVADFKLADSHELRCDVCGEPAGQGHVH
jgi:hypothetical protein